MVDAGAIAVIDGKDSMGQVLTAHAMEEPIRRSKARGIGAVGLRNSNHFVTAMYFTLMAARACVPHDVPVADTITGRSVPDTQHAAKPIGDMMPWHAASS